jgi:carbamoyl-phosphate synthase small subunit
LAAQGIVAITDVDTRFITAHLRDHGPQRAGIFSGDGLYDSAGRSCTDVQLVATVAAGQEN